MEWLDRQGSSQRDEVNPKTGKVLGADEETN
jgi:hypothetical protein